MDPTVDGLYEAGPPSTCAQLLDDADIYDVLHNVQVIILSQLILPGGGWALVLF